MVIGNLVGTLTRQYQIDDLRDSLSRVRPGMRREEAQAELDAAGHASHMGLAVRLLSRDGFGFGPVRDNELLRSCRAHRPDAHVLVWVALLIADYRLAELTETFLTRPDGRVDPDAFNAADLRAEIDSRGYGSAQKAASNLLRYFETAGLVAADRSGATIVGVDAVFSAAYAVPGVVALVRERTRDLERIELEDAEVVGFAIDRGVNSWLLMTAEDFRLAAGVEPLSGGPAGGQPIEREVSGESFRAWDEFKPKDESDYAASLAERTIVKSRSHEVLLNRYASWASSEGFDTSSPHPVDLLLRLDGQLWLVEAKVIYRGNATNALRAAIGQLFTYRHFLYRDANPLLVALFTGSIGEAYVELLDDIGIRSVWASGATWYGSDDALHEGLAQRRR